MPPLSSTAYETPVTAYKTPEWAVAAVAEGKDPADAGSNNLAKKIITGFTSLAAAAALTFTPVDAWAQGTISAEAFNRCEAELMNDYAAKIAKAQADGKPQFVPLLEKRRGEAIVTLCKLAADNGAADQKIAAADQKIATNRAGIAAGEQRIAAGEQRIAAGEQRIAAGEQRIAAGEQRIAAGEQLGTLFDEAKRIADRITAGSNNPADFKALNAVYAQLQERRSAPGVAEVLPLIASIIAKEKRLWGV
jgi:hypothetical protein